MINVLLVQVVQHLFPLSKVFSVSPMEGNKKKKKKKNLTL